MKTLSIKYILEQNKLIYGFPDDRLYSIEDFLYNHQKFINEYCKNKKIINIHIALSWFLAIVNRYHIDLENDLWKRYSFKCPFCLEVPCDCRIENKKTKKTGRPGSFVPKTISDWQSMILKIYPSDNYDELIQKLFNNLYDLSDNLRLFVRERKKSQFNNIEKEIIDQFVFVMRIYNLNNIGFEKEWNRMFKNGCYVCHKTPCQCNYFK